MFFTYAREKVFDHKYGVSHNVVDYKVCGIVSDRWTCASLIEVPISAQTHLILLVVVVMGHLISNESLTVIYADEQVFDHKYGVSHNIIEHKVCRIVAYMSKSGFFMQDLMTAVTA